MIRAVAFALVGTLAFGAASALAAEEAVKLEMHENRVDISIGGNPFTQYHFDKSQPKPYMMPIVAPGDVIITRPLATGEDHPHHKGVWVAVDEVNDIKFWAEKGKIENLSVKPLVASGNPAKLQVVNAWVGADGKPVVTETTVISIYANRLLSYDITFTAGENPVTFGDTKEGLFGIRLANSLREKETGKVTNAEGKKTTKECWGIPSDWVDYTGEKDGKTVGAAIFDHPKNFRKSRYHVRDYGLFTISPFGEKSYTNGKEEAKLVDLKPGAKLNLRYGLYLHAGDAAAGKVAEAYQQFIKAE